MQGTRTDHMLNCAITFRDADISEAQPLPKVYSSVEELLQHMMNVLNVEARENMQNCIEPPDDPYLFPVDIDTKEPGIVASKGKISDILRKSLPLPRVSYQRREPPTPLHTPVPNAVEITQARVQAVRNLEKNMQRDNKRAVREIERDNSTIEKVKKVKEKVQRRQNESEDERSERLAEAKQKRDARKQEKVDKVDNSDKSSLDDPTPHKKTVLTNVSPTNIKECLELDTPDVKQDGIFPTPLRVRTRKAKFYNSPVPHDRHLSALEVSWPSVDLQNALLQGTATDALRIIQGPPGTGKTHQLLECLNQFPTERVYVCASTNVGVANLYTRIVEAGINAALLMAPSRIPVGTPITSHDPFARIVCATISGRAGRILDGQRFDVVLLDEASQCMEACMWGLIRPEVRSIIMVGDTKQLPALVSTLGQQLGYDQSLMQRLVGLGYPTTELYVQRRMHPDILSFPNRTFYNGKLQSEYTGPVCNVSSPYAIKECIGDCVSSGESRMNKAEANMVLDVALTLREQFDNTVIITPYRAQCRQILALNPGCEVHTVDSFQGREADAVILSMVRTTDLGFWEDPRRIVVALTRARHCLRVVGHCSKWVGPLRDLFDDALKRECII